jgi:hypothetical protein
LALALLFISLKQLQKLCVALSVDPFTLLTSDSQTGEPKSLTFEELVTASDDLVCSKRITLASFEAAAGKSLAEAIDDPKACFSWNLDCLKDVSTAVGLDWLSFVVGNFQATWA